MRLWEGQGPAGKVWGGPMQTSRSPAQPGPLPGETPLLLAVITSPGEAPTCLTSHPTSWGPEHQTRGQD